ncbi:MAG: hypothetical protein WC891_08875 [Actinomycetota bacterium]
MGSTFSVSGPKGDAGTPGVDGTDGVDGQDAPTIYLPLTYTIDNDTSAITTGDKQGLVIPFSGSIIGWTALSWGGISGSIVIDIWKDTYANFPPTVADSICASALPTISSSTKGQSFVLTGWSPTITAGDIPKFNVVSCTDIKRVTLTLWVQLT